MDQTTRRLQDRELQEYCDRFTQRFLRGHTPLDVDVEVVGADIGDQHETELGRLHGLVPLAFQRLLSGFLGHRWRLMPSRPHAALDRAALRRSPGQGPLDLRLIPAHPFNGYHPDSWAIIG